MASAFTLETKTLLFIFFLSSAVTQSETDESSKVPQNKVRFGDVLVVVLSQPHLYHARRAELFRHHFEEQVAALPETNRPDLILSHEKYPEMQGAWTVFPLITQFATQYQDKKWVVVCEEDTRLDLKRLLHLLQQHDESEGLFLGRALRDQQATIIHHFAFLDDPSAFAYPDFAAGMALSLSLVKRLAGKLSRGTSQEILFSIDPKHELAKYILDNLGERLTPVCEFCGSRTSKSEKCQCATWQPTVFPTDCGSPVDPEDLFVAVKTCSKFHEDRVPVVKKTWGKETKLIAYYSEKEDPSIPTINLGVPNTERGHCGKTKAILHHFAGNEKLSSVEWLLIADDDTLINLELVRHLLACYKSEEPVFLGERYGYAVTSGYGYNYITGGGGMVFNRAAVNLLVEDFACSSDDAPDDMFLGMFFSRRGITALTHSRYFHQARPEDYSEDFLKMQVPVSFHKHWMNDPYKVYERLKVAKLPQASSVTHEEL